MAIRVHILLMVVIATLLVAVGVTDRSWAQTSALLEEDFTSNHLGWELGKNSGSYVTSEVRLVGGKLEQSLQVQSNGLHRVWVPELSLVNFDFTVETAMVETSGKGSFVLLSFREDDDGNYYTVRFAQTGSYIVELRYNNKWQTLHPWTASQAIDFTAGAVNTFGVKAQGSFFTISANGQELLTIQDTLLQGAGVIGIGAGGSAGESIVATFDNVHIAPVAATTHEQVIFTDDFTSNQHEWNLGQATNEYGDVENRLVEGQLQKSMHFLQSATSWSVLNKLKAKNFTYSIETTVTSSTSPDKTSAILFFRKDPQDNYYAVYFSNAGSYKIGLFFHEEWIELQPWTSTNALNLEIGETNTLSVRVNGAFFTVYVNGEELTTVTNDSLTEAGWLGFGMSGPAEATSTLVFDNLRITDVQSAVTAERQPVAGYTWISDQAGTISVLVPETWTEIQSAIEPMTSVETAGLFITATTKLEDVTVPWSWMRLSVLAKPPQVTTLSDLPSLLPKERLAEDCATPKRYNYRSEQYSGPYYRATDCFGDTTQALMLVALSENNPELLLLITIASAEEIDINMVDQILDSLTVHNLSWLTKGKPTAELRT